ncbi:MAG: NAD-dependent protein deacylase, partial [Aeromonas veronii]
YSALAQCDLFISIGTSGAVYPAAGFVHEAGLNGAHTIELNLEPSEVGSQFDEKRYGPASLLVPAYVDELLEACGIHQPRQVEGHNWMEMRGP